MAIFRVDPNAQTAQTSEELKSELDGKTNQINENFAQNIEDVQGRFDDRINSIETQQAQFANQFTGTINDIRNDFQNERLDARELLNPLKSTYEEQIGNLSNAYNAQVAREAERVDALIAGGALGGNSYRAFSAHNQSSRQLLGQAAGQIAELSIDAESTLAQLGVSIAQTNAQLFAQTSQTIASLTAAYADSMLSYSQLLVQTEVSAQQSIQNLYQLSLSERELTQNLLLQTRNQDIELELGYLQSRTQLEVANLNNPRPASRNTGTPLRSRFINT